MKTTLEDVAKAAGVSKSLVSKCLAGAPDARMRVETRKRIEEAVRKCHYLPSRLAQSLKKGRSRTIGLVISDLRNPFWAALADFALREAEKSHYRLLISLCEFCPQEELEHLRALIEYRVDGVLYCERLGDFEWKEILLEEHFPMMLMFQNSSTFPSASADYREALAGAVKHLAGHGCRELLCLHSGESEWPRILRSECRRAGLRFSVRSAPLNPEELGAFLDRICREAPPALLLNGWRTGLMLVQRMEEFFPPLSAGTDPEFPFRPSGFSERSDHGAGPERSGKSGPPEYPEPDRSNRGRTRGKSAFRSGVPDSCGAAQTDAGSPSESFPILKNNKAFCQKGET